MCEANRATSPRMQRHIGEFFMRAGGKIKKICKRINGVCVLTNFKKWPESDHQRVRFPVLRAF